MSTTGQRAFIAAVMLLAACDSPAREPAAPDVTFPTSLHATGRGMITWYQADNGGFAQYSGIPYDQLYCRNCHKPLCVNCHVVAGDSVPQSRCLGCHGLVQLEWDSHADVHHESGMDCMQCHSLREMHGDGTRYYSLLDDGAMDTTCENCHTPLADNEYHARHGNTIDCTACHVQGVVTCYVCHFETELAESRKVSYGQYAGWVFLVNYRGKVHSANFQSVKYREHSFLAMAPFGAHTIGKAVRQCEDCHESAALEEYLSTGSIQVTRWNDRERRIEYASGVVPVPPDWQTALEFDFVDLDDGGNWVFMESGPDAFQMLFGTPLTREQMARLGGVEIETDRR
jgi:hypothetical protein